MNKERMSQKRRLLLLHLLLLSIESVMSRSVSSDEWQRPASTRADSILPCVESDSCRGRTFGSMSEDVSKFGNVPPCRSHGWVRCIENPGPSMMDASQYSSTPKYSNHQQNKNSFPPTPSNNARQLSQENAQYLYKTTGQERPKVPPHFVSANTRSSLEQPQKEQSEWRQQQQKDREMHPSVVEIPKHGELQRNMAVVKFHQNSHAAILPPVNKQSNEHWLNQPATQRSRPESQGLTQSIQRPVEFLQPRNDRFEQSSQHLTSPFINQQQQQSTRSEFFGMTHKQQQQPVHFQQFAQHGQQTEKTLSFAHHPDISSQQRPLATPISPMPVESQRLTGASELDQSFQQMHHRVEPVRLIEASQKIISNPHLIEPPSQQKVIEAQQQQRFGQVNQPFPTDTIKKEHAQQMVQGNKQLIELQRPSNPFAGQQPENPFENKPQRQIEPQRLAPLTTQRSAEKTPRKLEPPPLVKSNSLGESPQFIEPAKSPIENLFQFDSSVDTQLAREQLAGLIRFLAQSASQQTDPNKEMFGVITPNQSPAIKSESNIVPFIAFSEPLPLEPSSNSLF